MQLRKATRQKAKIRLGLSAVSGGGKTYSAILIGKGLAGGDLSKVAVIDSENGSADLYAHLGNYNVLPISAPYNPGKYIEAIAACVSAGMEVIIIDSISHEWNGKGGCLDMHEQAMQKQRQANSFTASAAVTPLHQAFIDAILQCPAHIISTVRSKSDYVLTEKNGKQVPQKVGMAAQTRDGFEYELTVSLELDIEHKAFVSKDRTGLFIDKPAFTPTEETGTAILEWCESGIDVGTEVRAAMPKLSNAKTVEELTMLKATLPDYVVKDSQFIEAGKMRYAEIMKDAERLQPA